ncbi:hypothetical protein IQ13_3332 [Lacibacter cauensis]|uniref:Uncharacterized protein n=1 Tax=Lacibacter cauensis TaxID=510947 RepID=A0A562SHX7_9BACT|nr:hypothetical protein [Lacibacter cauensis]TWI80653.1 hypothetical protein IQ13_3332 [Lacibacter cauensis]
MQDTRNVLLVIVSLCLVATWGYHLYDKNRYAADMKAVVPVKDSLLLQSRINDSLRSAYNTLLQQMDSSRNAVQTDTSTTVVGASEIDSLRTEIAAILAINDITKEDLKRAEQKIKQLQQRLAQNAGTTAQVPVDNRTTVAVTSAAKTDNNSKPQPNEVQYAVSGISFRAMERGRELPTAKADAAGYLNVGAAVQTASATTAETEVFMVITDPSGDVIQDDPWQSGMFTMANDDRQAYTRKAKVQAKKGEPGRFAVNLKLPEFSKGAYSVQFYLNGVRVGRSELRLN